MPRDNLNRYYVPGGYGQRTITRMSRMAYARSANSTAMYARPYATADSLIQRVDGDLPPFATASNPGPAHSASPPLQRSSDLHDRATASVPDRFPTSSLSRPGSLSEPP